METPPATLDRLKLLAASEAVGLEALGADGLADLLARGLIQKDERPQQASLEARYEALQDTHRQVLEARACVDRLRRRMAPRSRLVGLLPHSHPGHPGAEDPDAVLLHSLLQRLNLQVRGVEGPGDLTARLDRIQDYLHVEGRECLDRLADTDRDIDQLQKQAPLGTLVEPEGFFTLTPAGEAALPETPVLEAFETVLQTAFGPLTHRSVASAHFREDPASLLAFLFEDQALGERPSALVNRYESLLEAYNRVSVFSDNRAPRAKVGFLVRLLRASREDPKRAFLWCNRERLHGLLTRMRALVPTSVSASGWHLPYAADLFLADGGITGESETFDQRTRLYEAVHRIQTVMLEDTRIADGQFVRLTLVLTHAARVRNFVPSLLLDRFLQQALDTMMEAAQAAPYDLGDRGTKLLFGAHLAHAAGFTKARLQEPLATFRRLQDRLREPEEGRAGSLDPVPVQVLLHAFTTLDRLERQGMPQELEAYAALFTRLHRRLRHHTTLGRALRHSHALAGEDLALTSFLTGWAACRGLTPAPAARFHPDAGMAGLYEDRRPGLPPGLGSPFGTLMLV
jgi:hypothetical protein